MIFLNKEMPEDILSIYKIIKCQIKFPILISQSKNNQSCVEKVNNTFIIKINTNLPDDYFWEVFLHEHIHIIQTLDGYQDIVSTKNEFITYYLNNTIMDIDVKRRLKYYYNFTNDSNYGLNKMSEDIINLIKGFIENGYTDDDIKILAISTVFINICHSVSRAEIVKETGERLSNNFNNYYNQFLNIVNQNQDISYKSVRKIQDDSIRLFGLKNYIFD